MKVNISYSVELEEVLSNSHELLQKERSRMMNQAGDALEQLKTPFNDDNLIHSLELIKECKESLNRFDTKLNEIYNILVGYGQLRYKEMQPDEPQPQEKTEDKND